MRYYKPNKIMRKKQKTEITKLANIKLKFKNYHKNQNSNRQGSKNYWLKMKN